jgi:hypothetical protein
MNMNFPIGFLDYWMSGWLIGSTSRESEAHLSINPASHLSI